MISDKAFIVIPAWNEEATIAKVVESVSPLGCVLVVDDCSSDRTAERAEAAGAIVISQKVNRGYGGAVSSGFDAAVEAGADYILTFDADGQHDIGNLKQAISLLAKGADIVVGIRPSRPRLSEKLFALTFYWFYGLRDPLCGLKGYRTRVYRDAGFFDRSGSYGADLLRFVCTQKKRYCIETIPVQIYDRVDSPRIGSRFKANIIILRGMIRHYVSRIS